MVLAAVLLEGCSITKRNPGKILIRETKLSVDQKALDYYDLDGLIRQHSNRRFLGMRLHTGVYNLGSAMKDRTLIKEKKIRKKIAKKEKKHPVELSEQQKMLEKSKRGFRPWLMNTVGEEPVFLDSGLTTQSVGQMELYCKKHGFFNAEVSDTVIFNKKKNKARVEYIIKSGIPYKINNVEFVSSDPNLKVYLISGKVNSLLKSGDIYNEDVLENERMRINDDLKNLGYYAFSKSYIRYEVDSVLGNNSLNIKLIINRPFKQHRDSTEFYNHRKYNVRRIFVVPDFAVGEENAAIRDTLKFVKLHRNKKDVDTVFFMYREEMRVKPKVIARKIFIRTGTSFCLNDANKTQAELSSLNIFKYINIRFLPDSAPTDPNMPVQMDAYIELSQSPVQSVNFEIEGTNSSGNLGTAGNFVYKNRNLFQGAEQFNFRFKGGLELQKSVFAQQSDVINGLPFNSAEISTEAGLATPVNSRLFAQSSHPMLNYSVGFNYQFRPYYQRYISHLKAQLDWRESSTQVVQFYLPINLVRILPDSLFAERISQFSRTIRYSYEDHFIPGFGISAVKSTQAIRKNRSYHYRKIQFEQAGVALWSLGNGFNNAMNGEVYRVLGINYSQFFKIDWDYRYYKPWLNQTMFVSRFFIGAGIPYGNSVLLPFEKSYSAAGSNDIRAWKFRSLGPGTYSDTTTNFFDRTGDICVVMNFEYRFPIISWFNGAFFVDAGNVWLKNASEEFPGGAFSMDFYKQIAVGAGFGLRLDFDFFIFRIDAAMPLRDPSLPENEMWQKFDKALKKTNISFGIGYPF
ncbi:Outer membrane protein assembly factor BamA [bioreactor metagenome]|uniref:Outer membrane protein assembly factor BamA n=1 Tax=bioreactor metagenome TaxID=1076179 RepID=A0A644X2S6_9ZZZZ